MNSRFLYGTIGHTAAGKTTLSNYMKDNPAFVFEYINEGEIKRGLVDAYSTTDSLNEELRDRSYRIAIEKAQSILLYHTGFYFNLLFGIIKLIWKFMAKKFLYMKV